MNPTCGICCRWLLAYVAVILGSVVGAAQTRSYPSNATSCEECHSVPSNLGSSKLTVQRLGRWDDGKYIPAVEGGIVHRRGTSSQGTLETGVVGERVTVNLLGDGFVEAISDDDLRRNAAEQRAGNAGIKGVLVESPLLESKSPQTRLGRFGWKSQHSSLMSACADSLRNELGIRNQLYPDEYANHGLTASSTPFDIADAKTGRTDLERLVDQVRHTAPPARDEELASSPDSISGETIFQKIGCSVCHVATYKTLPAGTLINGGTYRVPDFLGGQVIHPYSDFLLHDTGTGDGIPQAAKPEYLDQSTANKFRTAPLWGLRFRSWMMHDGKSITYHQAIMRHGGEATKIRERYEQLSPRQKSQLRAFLNSL
jgi:CxxC motif-containing protein (DUF1111 family)